jgi:hypothetical protein
MQDSLTARRNHTVRPIWMPGATLVRKRLLYSGGCQKQVGKNDAAVRVPRMFIYSLATFSTSDGLQVDAR